MMKKFGFIGLLTMLFIPGLIIAAAEPIRSKEPTEPTAGKPTVLIAFVVDDPDDLADLGLPFADFNRLMVRLLPDFNVRTGLLPAIAKNPENWNRVNYVFIVDYSLGSYVQEDIEKFIKNAGLETFFRKAYVQLVGQDSKLYAMRGLKDLFYNKYAGGHNIFGLEWMGKGSEQIFKNDEKYHKFEDFLKQLKDSIERKYKK